MEERRGSARRVTGCVALVAIVAIVATGCGAASGSDSGSAALSKAEFQKKAKSLCKASEARYLADAEVLLLKAKKAGGPPPDFETKLIASRLVPSMEKRTRELRALVPPKADEAQVDRILAAIERVIQEAREDPARFLYRQTNFKHPFHEANELAKKYGLSACARA
jgi:hypothetical protein